MNGLLVLALILAATTVVAILWGLRERMRASAAEMRVEMLR